MLFLAALILLSVAAPAEARIVVRSIDDLRADPAVAALESSFVAQASASVVYARCAGDLGITPQQQDYQRNLFARVAKQYSDSYYTTYVTKVGAPPPQKIVDFYAQYIANEQQAAMTNTDSFITGKGCNKSNIRKIYKDVETFRATEAAAEANKKKTYDPWSR